MLKPQKLLPLAGAVLLGAIYLPTTVVAQDLPICSSASADPDGDGYGWENDESCIVGSDAPAAGGGSDCVDTPPFDDDWGWNGTESCRLSDAGTSAGSGNNQGSGGTAECVDTAPFDDDWGWNGSESCRLSASNTDGGSVGNDDQGSTSTSSCVDTPPFDDDWGWDGSQSCRLSDAGTSTDSGSASEPDSSATAECVDTGVIGDGWGWNGSESCRIETADSGSGSGDNTGDGSGGDTGGDTGDSSGGDTGDGSGGNTGGSTPVATAGTSTFDPLSPVPADTCLTRQDTLNGNYHDVIRMGDFMLSTNAWNASAAGSFDWEQCIYANRNGARAGWNYRWGAGGGSNDFNVRSYPELIYGVKSQGEISAPKSVTGLPMRIGGMQDITIRYSFAGEEFGPPRPVDASVTPRFPNGTIITGERNVAVESFLHPADSNGQCTEGVVQRFSGFSNHTFEIMVWLDSGAERLPSGPGDFVTTVNLGGQSYDVYTKNSDRKYTAFVARNPQQSGEINWTDFVRWTQDNSHRVVERFGARTNSVQIQDDWCLANILIGNEIWWGDGYFDILEWQISRN